MGWNNLDQVKPLLNKFLFSKIGLTRCQTLYVRKFIPIERYFVKSKDAQYYNVLWKLRKILAAPYTVVWKTRNSLIETFFRQINFLVIYLVKHLLSRNFCKKMWKRISAISTPQCGKSQNLLSPKIFLVKSTI